MIFQILRLLCEKKAKGNKSKTRGWVVSHCGLAIYIKRHLKRQKKNHENSNISPCKNIIFKINPLKKETKILQRSYNSIRTNLNFQHKPKYYYLSKILI
jgi:hypothetical protein